MVRGGLLRRDLTQREITLGIADIRASNTALSWVSCQFIWRSGIWRLIVARCRGYAARMQTIARSQTVRTLLLAAGTLGFCALPSFARGGATMTPLTSPGGSTNWGPGDLSGNGLWLCGTYNTGWGHACTWSSAGQFTALGSLRGYAQSGAAGVNSDGTVVVGGCNNGNSDDSRAVRWTSTDGLTDLGGLNGATANYASAVSTDGTVIIGTSGNQCFRWTTASGMAPLNLGLPPGADSRKCYGLSGDGSTVIGLTLWHDFWGSYWTPFVWTALGGGQELGAIPGCRDGYPNASNEDGSVIVGASLEQNTGLRRHAFRFTFAHGMQDLGALGAGWTSEATHVSADGNIVFGNSSAPGASWSVPWVWTPWTGLQDLAGFLTAQGLDLSGIQRFVLAGVSGDASTIAITCFDGSWNVTQAYLISSIRHPKDTDGDGIMDEQDNCAAVYNPSQADCNHDGSGDACEIAAGAPDANHDSIPDYCECLADIFVDGVVNGADLGIVLSQWGLGAGAASDINRDGIVNGADLAIILSSWGACP